MLKIIGLKHFKSFESLDELKIKPLTLLCGVNSGGKSSLIKSLLILKQSYENSLVTNELTLNGNYTLNGTMKDILYRGQGNDFSLRNVFRLEYHGARYRGRAKQDLTSAREIGKMLDLSPNDVQCFELEIVCTISRKHEEGILESNYISNYIINVRPFDKMNKLMKNKAFSVQLQFAKKSQYDVTLQNFPSSSGKVINEKFKNCACYFSGMRLNNLYYQGNDKNIMMQDFLVNLYSICRIAASQYDGIKYLGPLRDTPDRQYAIYKNTAGFTTTGSEAPYLLVRNGKKKIHKEIHAPVSEIEFDTQITNKDSTVLELVHEWMNYLGLGNIEIKNNENTIQLNIEGNNIADVGFGVGQALPILVEGITMNYEQSFLIEQPEIHLHPRMQMRMADFLITLAATNHNFIVETHSDHIINRIVRRALECRDNSLIDNIAIYFVDNVNQKSIIEEIVIDRVAGITKCPEAFFGQFASETSHIVRAGLNNISKGN